MNKKLFRINLYIHLINYNTNEFFHLLTNMLLQFKILFEIIYPVEFIKI
jgi:hypothetical protein